ncbi:small ribosomal subunit biogenesis GTPase RsgA 1, mitochondrial-like [Triticum urartu]|uniref:Ribosome biogenesis GTPase RsgA n=1 Tax=Triticum urartu TaxID=4572 RepID=A0A8R7TI64_TRIUA|nr:small ribosomal subunit biogenesis GTPase RsgA 1, mitochondrial-like [Triticum urartu]XP_048557036.1 small ribosomal subunit biogenesis GTPase RsgA 1, mitochondrial-like [Triticum urartu]
MPLLPPPSTATLPHLRLPLPLPLPQSLRLLHRASRHPRLPPAVSAASLPPPPPDALLPNQATGLVAASQANFMRVIVSSTAPGLEQHQGTDLLCVVRALLKKIRRRVLVGDRVLVGAVDWTDRRGMIEDVFERRSEVVDPPVANVDRLVVLFSLDQPQPEPATLTRFLVEAESTGIPFVLAFNKVELVDDQIISYWRDRLKSWGYDPLFLSVDQRSGLSALEEMLEGQTTVVVGPSGVGKSSLINALRCNQNISEEDPIHQLLEQNSKWFGEQRVGTVSKKSGKGKHTTRHVSLLPIVDGGFLADTPGFNQPSLMKVTKRGLAETFPEIRKMLEENESSGCLFNDCVHLGEHGCVVKGDWERYPHYLQLLDEIKIRESFQLRTFGTKREGDVRYKTGTMGVKQAEPRLQLKKHRRVSRKKLNQSILDEMDSDMDDLDDDYQFGVSRRTSKR